MTHAFTIVQSHLRSTRPTRYCLTTHPQRLPELAMSIQDNEGA